jgi:hypothetical protein
MTARIQLREKSLFVRVEPRRTDSGKTASRKVTLTVTDYDGSLKSRKLVEIAAGLRGSERVAKERPPLETATKQGSEDGN